MDMEVRWRNGDQLEGLSSGANCFYKDIAERVPWTSNVRSIATEIMMLMHLQLAYAVFGNYPSPAPPRFLLLEMSNLLEPCVTATSSALPFP